MTEQQYKRAVWIYERLNTLERVKKEINDSYKHRLSYIWKGDSEWRACDDWDMKEIGELLDKHDTMIRAEIEVEISDLLNEIETL